MKKSILAITAILATTSAFADDPTPRTTVTLEVSEIQLLINAAIANHEAKRASDEAHPVMKKIEDQTNPKGATPEPTK